MTAVYHADGLGSTRALSNAAGTAVADTYMRDAWGGVATGGSGSSTQAFGYTGEQRDAETGLLHLRARAYDPGTGRFVQRDRVPGVQGVPTILNRNGSSGCMYGEGEATITLDRADGPTELDLSRRIVGLSR